MYIQNQNDKPLILNPSLSAVAEDTVAKSDYDYYTQGVFYYKDVVDSKMQRRDSGIDLPEATFPQNIFHDFITEQDQCEENQSDANDVLESSIFADSHAISPPNSNSSCEEYNNGNWGDVFPKFYKVDDASMDNLGQMRIYSYFTNLDEVLDIPQDIDSCNLAAISPPSPITSFGDHPECYPKGFSYEYQFAMHPGPLSPISPTHDQFPCQTENDSDCNSLASTSNEGTPEPVDSPLIGSLSLVSDADAEQSVSPTPVKPQRSRGRRVSNRPDIMGGKLFTCKAPSCGKVFKRSEHLKRHHRSIHTTEKPFPCPIPTCSKRFSRSDNLNQHIRIHRHNKDSMKYSGRHFSNFTPFCSR